MPDPRDLPSVGATIDYAAEGSSRPVARGVQVHLAGGSTAAGDLRPLLRRRLRVAASLTLGVYAYFVALWGANEGYDLRRYHPQGVAYLTLIHGTFLAELFAAAVLWLRPLPSLRALRRIEGVALAFPLLHLIWFDVDPLFFQAVYEVQAGTIHGSNDLARVRVFPWFVLVITYGVLIPNTWRRSALVLSGLSALALAMHVSAAVYRGALWGHQVMAYLVEMGVWLGFATGVVVANAYRLDVLGADTAAARQLGQYRLGRRLGAGGMGEVYLAEHLLLRRPAALKLIRPDRAGDPQTLTRFEREVKATAALTHPNTVQVFDYGRADDGAFYYVMEYLPGLTLDELVKDGGAVPPARAVHLLRQVCGALAEAHGIGLVHRDLKPGNVMLCERGGAPDVVKLLDFGLVLPVGGAADGDKLTRDGVVSGTPAYMSPEQAGGAAEVGPASDIYSLGAVAYCLLTGRPPFAGRSAMQALAAQMYEPPEPPSARRPGVPADLEAVVLRCLAKAPADRFADVRALAAALAACGSGGGWSEADARAWWRSRPVAAADVEPGGDAVGTTRSYRG